MSSKIFGSALTRRNIIFFSTPPLTIVSNIETTYDSLSSFSWNSDNSAYCYGGDKNYLSVAYSAVHNSSKQFGCGVEHNIVSFAKTKPDRLISAGQSDLATLWQIKAPDIYPLRGFNNLTCKRAQVASFSLDDTCAIIGGPSKTDYFLCLFEINSAQIPYKSFSLGPKESPSFVEFSPHNRSQFAVSTGVGSFHLFDVTSDSPIISLHSDTKFPSLGLYFLPHHRNEIMLACSEKQVNIYDMHNRKTSSTVPLLATPSSFCPLQDGNNFLIGTTEGKIYQYDYRRANHPIDCLETNKSTISLISTQKGAQVPLETIGMFPFCDTESIKSKESVVFAKSKRSANKDLGRTSTSFKDNVSLNIKSFKHMFASPAVKKFKSTSRESVVGTPKYDTMSLASVAMQQNTPEAKPEYRCRRQTTTTMDSDIKSPDYSLSLQDVVIETAKSGTLDEDSYMDLKYYMHSAIRELQFNLVRQQFQQSIEIKKYVEKIVNDSLFREQELLEENQRLRDELIKLKNMVKTMNLSAAQSDS